MNSSPLLKWLFPVAALVFVGLLVRYLIGALPTQPLHEVVRDVMKEA